MRAALLALVLLGCSSSGYHPYGRADTGCYQPAPDQVAVAIDGELKMIVPLKGGMATLPRNHCKVLVELAQRLPP